MEVSARLEKTQTLRDRSVNDLDETVDEGRKVDVIDTYLKTRRDDTQLHDLLVSDGAHQEDNLRFSDSLNIFLNRELE